MRVMAPMAHFFKLEYSCLLRDGFNLVMKNTSSIYMLYHFLGQQVKHSTKRSVLCYQQKVWLLLIYCQQNYVLSNVLQHYEWFHQCKFFHNCIYLYKFCMTDENYDLKILQLWGILLAAPKDDKTCKNLEAFFIAKLKPFPNRRTLTC